MEQTYNAVLSAVTSEVTITVLGFDPLLHIAVPAWAQNTDPPLGSLYISAQSADSITVRSNAEEGAARNVLLVVYGSGVVQGTSIISLADLKLYLGISTTDTSHDTLLNGWITEVTTEIESYESGIGQPVASIVKTDYLDGKGTEKIYLNSGSIISLVGATEAARLANLQYRESVTDGWVDLLTDEDLIYLNPKSKRCIEILDGYTFPVGQRNIRVSFNAGLNPIPGDIVNMAKQKIQIRWDESKTGSNMLGKQSKSVGEGGMSYSSSLREIEAEWRKIINRYKFIQPTGISSVSIYN